MSANDRKPVNNDRWPGLWPAAFCMATLACIVALVLWSLHHR